MRFLLAKCVWGAAYVDTMLTMNLPSLMAPGNLPALRGGFVEHAIFTTPEDAVRIERHPTYQALRALVPCRIVTLPAKPTEGTYLSNIARMNDAHCRILRECEQTGAAWLFDQPDHIWGDGSLAYLVRRALGGARCVMFAGIRTVLEEVAPALELLRSNDGTVITLSNPALLRLAIRHFHAHDRVRIWGTPVACTWPHHVSWRVAPNAFLRRAFFAQPFLISGPAAGHMPERSIDANFVPGAFPELKGVEFIKNTDEFLVIEVSPRIHVPEHNFGPIGLPMLAAWAVRHATPDHMRFFEHPIRFDDGNVPEHRWQRIERLSERITNSVRRARAWHDLLAGLGAERPSFASLLGRLLRDGAFHRWLRLPERVTLLLPSDPCIAGWTSHDPTTLVAPVLDHLLAGDTTLDALADCGTATALSGRSYPVRRDPNGVMIGDRRVVVADDMRWDMRIQHLDGFLKT